MKFLAELSESKLYPSSTKLDREEHGTLTTQAHMMFMALYVLLCEESTREWAEKYTKKTLRGDFKSWRSDATDLYAVIYALHSGKYEAGHYRTFSVTSIKKWLRDVQDFKKSDDSQVNIFLFRLDTLFEIKNSDQRSTRRHLMDWRELKNNERRVYFTKLLYLFRHKALKSEFLPKLEELARNKKYEIDESEDAAQKSNLLKEINTLEEDASAGATGSSSVATSVTAVGSIGAGFDPNGHKGIYQDAKKPVVLKRNPDKKPN